MEEREYQFDYIEQKEAIGAALAAAVADGVNIPKNRLKKYVVSYIYTSLKADLYDEKSIDRYIKMVKKQASNWKEIGRYMLYKFRGMYISPVKLVLMEV